MKTTITTLLLALCLMITPATGSAQEIVDATDPNELLNVAKGFGNARLGEDGIGDPQITGRIEGIKYRVYFWMCEDNKNCKDIQFWAGWSGTDVTMDDVNAWNAKMRFGKAYIDDEDDPILTYTVNLNGGVTYDNIEDSFDWWKVVLTTFVDEVLGSGE